MARVYHTINFALHLLSFAFTSQVPVPEVAWSAVSSVKKRSLKWISRADRYRCEKRIQFLLHVAHECSSAIFTVANGYKI
uniref:Putative secreted protein n=1 Tax=Anopheles darlingi TaxID=43151 RepID=A0A2M4DGT8_ANODA